MQDGILAGVVAHGKHSTITKYMKKILSRRQILILAATVVAGAVVGYFGPIVFLNLLVGGSLF